MDMTQIIPFMQMQPAVAAAGNETAAAPQESPSLFTALLATMVQEGMLQALTGLPQTPAAVDETVAQSAEGKEPADAKLAEAGLFAMAPVLAQLVQSADPQIPIVEQGNQTAGGDAVLLNGTGTSATAAVAVMELTGSSAKPLETAAPQGVILTADLQPALPEESAKDASKPHLTDAGQLSKSGDKQATVNALAVEPAAEVTVMEPARPAAPRQTKAAAPQPVVPAQQQVAEPALSPERGAGRGESAKPLPEQGKMEIVIRERANGEGLGGKENGGAMKEGSDESGNLGGNILNGKHVVESAKKLEVQSAPEKLPQVSRDDILSQVKEGIERHPVKQDGQITIKLNPAELGEIQISVRLDDQRVRVEVVAANRAVRESLMENIDSLKDSLLRQRLTMESFDVSGGNEGNAGQLFREWREQERNRGYDMHKENLLPEDVVKNSLMEAEVRQDALVDVRL